MRTSMGKRIGSLLLTLALLLPLLGAATAPARALDPERYKVLLWIPEEDSFYSLGQGRSNLIYLFEHMQQFNATVTVAQKHSGKLTEQELDGVQLVYISAVTTGINTANGPHILDAAQMLRDFADRGGRVILNGEFGGAAKEGNALLSALAARMGGNFTIDPDEYDNDRTYIVNTDIDDPLMDGVVAKDFPAGTVGIITSTKPDAVWLMRTSAGTNFVVDQPVGYGHITVLSDNTFLHLARDKADYEATVRRFLFNLLKDSAQHMQEIANSCKVTFVPNGGAGTMADQEVTENAPTALRPNAFTRAGYGFVKWNTAADGSGTDYTDRQTVTLANDLTLYAQWEKTGFAIRFDANGGAGTMADQGVTKNVPAALTPNAFTRAGYRFVKWNTKADGSGTDYADRASVTTSKDLTLYAQWEEIRAIVTFRANGGTGEMEKQSVRTSTPTALTPNTFTRAGYTFERWNTKADGSGTDYADAQTVTLTQDIVLYAIWSPCITFHANDGSGRKLVQDVVLNKQTTLQKNPFARTGATFLKWNTAADGSGTDYADRENVGVVTENLVLYAQWHIHEYTVHYHANGGIGEMEDQAFTYGTPQQLRPCGFNNGRLRFAGWALSMSGSAVYSERQTVSNLTAADKAVVTLYAVWKDDTPDARVSAWQGNKNFGAANGKLGDWYHFDVPGKLYDLVTEQGNRTVTTLVRAGEEGITGYSSIPAEPVNSVLVVGAGTPDIVVGGLDTAAYEGYRGRETTLTMRISSMSENLANVQHNAIRAVAKDRQLEFYDISLTRTANGTYDRTFYGETEGNLQIYFPLHGTPEDVEVYRWHDGVVETLPFDKNCTEYAAVEDGYLMVSAKKFSTYAIGYPMGQCPRDYRCPISAFPDASTQAWYHDGVHWALVEGAMVGMPGQRFEPNDNISRAQIVTMLWRLSGCPHSGQPCPFTDAQSGHWFSDAVRWAADEGVVKGRSETIFDPNAPVTREELATILYRYTKKLNALPSEVWWLFLSDFADSDNVSNWAYEAVNWAAFSEIFVGTLTPEGSRWLNPQGNATRAQTATVFMRWWEGLRS